MTDAELYLKSCAALTDAALKKYLGGIPCAPPVLLDAMMYSVEAGGKRIRPALVMASAEALGLGPQKVIPAACAVEMVHTYSLIHDDLPAMDNDDFRRGKPTNHRVFGEATAILAGDALLTRAFEIFCCNAEFHDVGFERVVKAMSALAAHAGASGMAGGQIADLEAENFGEGGKKEWGRRIFRATGKKSRSPAALVQYIHLRKTAALIAASVQIGAVLAGAGDGELRGLSNFGERIGLAFQITDDILDVTADKKMLGKAGSDLKNQKLTYVSVYGLETAGKKACALVKLAHKSLDDLKHRSASALKPLHDLADLMVSRSY